MDNERLKTLGIIKARKKGANTWVEGYIFKLESPMRIFKSDPEEKPVWYAITSQSTDWGLPCIPQYTEIDPDTICECCAILPNGKKLFVGDKLSAGGEQDLGAVSLVEGKPFLPKCNLWLYELLEAGVEEIKVIETICGRKETL